MMLDIQETLSDLRWNRSESTASVVSVALSSATRTQSHIPRSEEYRANTPLSVEHDDVAIVAVNDPFIEPHYAVSSLQLQLRKSRRWTHKDSR